MSPFTRAALVGLRVVALVSVVAGCAGSNATAPPAVDNVTGSDLETLHLAEQVLLWECMAQAGFEYYIIPMNPLPEAREFPYVIDDLAWATRHGYGADLQLEMDRLHKDDLNQRYFRGLPEERRAAALVAINGERPEGLTARTPDGMALTRSDTSCQSTAERELYGDLPAWFQAKSTVVSLPPMREARVLADPEFAEAVLPWAECMRVEGKPHTSPQELRDVLPELALSAEQEIELAVVEARCAVSSGLAATAAALDRRHGKELERQYQSDVDTVARLRNAALPRARSIIDRA